MRRTFFFPLSCVALLFASQVAFADETPAAPAASNTAPTVTWAVPSGSSAPQNAPPPVSPPSPATTSATPPAISQTSQPSQVAPASFGHGVAVLATDGSSDAAWRLALRVYRGPLRPAQVDEAHARALAGEAPAPNAPRDIQDLYETRAAVHGDDAPSRRLLSSIADSLGVEAILVVTRDSGAPVARMYFANTSSFDAARYTEDSNAADPWQPAVMSLERSLHTDVPASTPPLKVEPQEPQASRPFYKSPWFWGAVGAAVFAGGAVFLATRDDSDSGGPVHVQMKVPR